MKNFKPGQWVFAIEVEDDCFEEKAEICGYLFMAECGDYVIGCGEYKHLIGDFEAQLEEMYKESLDCELELYLIRKDLCFETEKEANEYLKKMLEE